MAVIAQQCKIQQTDFRECHQYLLYLYCFLTRQKWVINDTELG